jgi:hypothetical protein
MSKSDLKTRPIFHLGEKVETLTALNVRTQEVAFCYKADLILVHLLVLYYKVGKGIGKDNQD